jgi:nucleolar GTP-binding protein
MVGYNFKKIATVPNAKTFVDIVLTRTQRKTPTIVHKGYAITTLRKFYMRKVKFTQQTINDKLQQMLSEFPILDDIHPFYADLMNVLYDKDFYKLALGQLHNAKRVIDNIAADYLRLLKYGDSLYRCKQLKRAALGRMVKVLRRQDNNLQYLEQVRQHMGRLPSINPNGRTLLVCGYPNVGKSSFMNKVTRAKVDVQAYAFTTQSLFVGHTDYKLRPFQVIDTPGILDHPLEDRNVIEMQSITAMAHLKCAILYFIDISEQCNYTIAQQVALFFSIADLFKKKPLIIVLNKIDVRRVESLSEDERALIESITQTFPEALVLPMSTVSEEGVSEVKKQACEQLLAMRTEMLLKGTKRDEILSRMHVAMPKPRDDVVREAWMPVTYIDPLTGAMNPGKVARSKLAEWADQQHLYHEMDPDYVGMDWRKYYDLENEDERYDVIPEFYNGENIADWMDPSLAEKLEALEEEEAELLRQLAALPIEAPSDGLTPLEELKLERIRSKKAQLITRHRNQKLKNASLKPLQQRVGSASEFEDHLTSMGIDPSAAVEHLRERSQSRARGRKRVRDDMEVDVAETKARRSMSRSGIREDGFKDDRERQRAEKFRRRALERYNREGRSGPGDNSIPNLMPKHLFSGKRGIGSNERR